MVKVQPKYIQFVFFIRVLLETYVIYDTLRGFLGCMQGHTGGLATLALSADGTTLATGSRDRTVRIWDTTNVAQT